MSQQEHASRVAWSGEMSAADAELIAVVLLHILPDDATDNGSGDVYEELGKVISELGITLGS